LVPVEKENVNEMMVQVGGGQILEGQKLTQIPTYSKDDVQAQLDFCSRKQRTWRRA